MCTAVLEVPVSPDRPVRLLAIRDEDPARDWDLPGQWWPDREGVIGVRDRRAGGAWLAKRARSGHLAVMVNRAESERTTIPDASHPLVSRGPLVLDAVMDHPLANPPGTANFNLVEIVGSRASMTSWDGTAMRRTDIPPGVHMIAHHDLDDVTNTARIQRWLPSFQRLANLPDDTWKRAWLSVLEASSELSPEDDAAMIRDNRVHGYNTLSLLVCLAEVSANGVCLESAALAKPGAWDELDFTHAG